MLIKNTRDDFGLITKLLHWLIAGLIIFLIWLGWYMVDLSYFDKSYNSSLEWHKSLGMAVLGLGLVKIGWQVYTPSPPVSGKLRPWEQTGAAIIHWALIALMVLLPATGYLISTSAGQSVPVFDWFEIPALLGKNETLRDIAIDLHFYLAYGAALLIIGHAGAALKHEFVDKDRTLTRMLWK